MCKKGFDHTLGLRALISPRVFWPLVREFVKNLLLNVADMVGVNGVALMLKILVGSISNVICYNCMRYSENTL